MVTWPASLPQDQFLGLTDTRMDARVRSGEGAGYAKMRRRSTAVARPQRVPIVLSGAQLAMFNDFYATDLAEGALPFDWEDPVTDLQVAFRFGSATPTFRIKLGGPPAARIWQGVLELEILPPDVQAVILPPQDVAASDALRVALSEAGSRTIATAVSAADNLRPRLAETGAVTLVNAVSASDALAPVLTQANALAVARPGADALAPLLTEAGTLAAARTSTDAVALVLTEVGTAAIARASTDALAPALSEAGSVVAAVAKAGADALAPAVTEAGEVTAKTKAGADALAPAVTEAGVVVVAVAKAGADAVSAAVTDAGARVLGAPPAFGEVGVTTTSLTLVGTHAIAYPPGVQLNDLLLVPALGRNTNPDVTMAMHADMVADGWQHVAGPFGPSSTRSLLLAWKFADADDVAASAAAGNIAGGIVGSTVAPVTSEFLGHCQRWTSAAGWAANPFENVASSTKGFNVTIVAPTVTPTNVNRLAVSIFGGNAATDPFIFAGATGGSWSTMRHITGVVTVLTTQVSDISAGAAAVTGGGATLSTSASGPVVGLALVPAIDAPAAALEYGGVVVEYGGVPVEL